MISKSVLVSGAVTLFAALSFCAPRQVAAAPGGDFRLLVHGTKRVAETPWGVAG